MKQMLQVRVGMHYIGSGRKIVKEIGGREVVVKQIRYPMTALSEDCQYRAVVL